MLLAHIHNSQHNQIFFIPFKLIQQSNMVIVSCLAKKNQNLNARKKKFSLLLKVAFSRQKYLQTSLFSNKLNLFPRIQILIFLREATQNDHIRLLYKFERDKKNLLVLGVMDMRQLLLMTFIQSGL